MKWLFFFCLFMNLLVFAWGNLIYQPKQAVKPPPPVLSAKTELKLLSELGYVNTLPSTEKFESTTSEEQRQEELQSVEIATEKPLICYRLGPLMDNATATVVSTLKSLGITADVQAITVKYLVVSPVQGWGGESRQLFEQWQHLAETSLVLKGEFQGSVLFGFYADLGVAQQQQQMLKQQGVNTKIVGYHHNVSKAKWLLYQAENEFGLPDEIWKVLASEHKHLQLEQKSCQTLANNS